MPNPSSIAMADDWDDEPAIDAEPVEPPPSDLDLVLGIARIAAHQSLAKLRPGSRAHARASASAQRIFAACDRLEAQDA